MQEFDARNVCVFALHLNITSSSSSSRSEDIIWFGMYNNNNEVNNLKWSIMWVWWKLIEVHNVAGLASGRISIMHAL